MKIALAAALAVLSLAFLSDLSVAQGNNNKKSNTTTAAMSSATCTTGQTCSTNCDGVGWCSRMVCAGNKWEKRLLSCVGGLCPPRC